MFASQDVYREHTVCVKKFSNFHNFGTVRKLIFRFSRKNGLFSIFIYIQLFAQYLSQIKIETHQIYILLVMVLDMVLIPIPDFLLGANVWLQSIRYLVLFFQFRCILDIFWSELLLVVIRGAGHFGIRRLCSHLQLYTLTAYWAEVEYFPTRALLVFCLKTSSKLEL